MRYKRNIFQCIVAPVSGRGRAKRSAWHCSGTRRGRAVARSDVVCLELENLWECVFLVLNFFF